MKSNISNELIKRIYANAGTPIRKELEKEVPELFKPKVNAWYWRDDSKELLFFNNGLRGNDVTYCIVLRGRTFAFSKGGINSNPNKWILATPKEVEDHLIKIAEEKGFKEGVRTGNCPKWGDNSNHPVRGAFRYVSDEDGLTNDNTWMYYQGKWATIIKEESPIELTLSDIAKLKGVDVSRIRIVD